MGNWPEQRHLIYGVGITDSDDCCDERTGEALSPARRQPFINYLPVRLTSLSLTS
jgi:hypothetical protein